MAEMHWDKEKFQSRTVALNNTGKTGEGEVPLSKPLSACTAVLLWVQDLTPLPVLGVESQGKCCLTQNQTHPKSLPAPCPVLTGEDGWHERSKHEEQHGKKEESRVAEDLLGFIANAQVEQPNEQPDANVGGDPQVCQDL